MPVVTASSYSLGLSFYSWLPLGTCLCAAHIVLTGSHEEENLGRARFDSQPHQRASCEPWSISFHLHSSLLHSKMNIVALTYSTVNYKNINVPVTLKCYTDKHRTEACLNIHREQRIVRSKCLAICLPWTSDLSLTEITARLSCTTRTVKAEH